MNSAEEIQLKKTDLELLIRNDLRQKEGEILFEEREKEEAKCAV